MRRTLATLLIVAGLTTGTIAPVQRAEAHPALLIPIGIAMMHGGVSAAWMAGAAGAGGLLLGSWFGWFHPFGWGQPAAVVTPTPIGNCRVRTRYVDGVLTTFNVCVTQVSQ